MANYRRLTRPERGIRSQRRVRGPDSYDPPVALAKEAVPDKIRISSSEWNMEITIEELRPASQFQPTAFYMPNLPDIRKVDLDKIK